ncbi:MAG: Do family serine endopeptidase [Bacteroidales bacterium]|nr:Do family serine endopeptidase [Bacteroidales bacterium]
MKRIFVTAITAFMGAAAAVAIMYAVTPRNLEISDSTLSNHQNDFVQKVSYVNPSAGGIDFTEAAEKVMPTVVHIATKTTVRSSAYPPGFDLWKDFFGDSWDVPQKENVQQASGSGVIVQKDGYIVTNNHVVKGADEISVTLHDKGEFTAKVIGTDPNTDLALIKIEADDLSAISFANSDDVKVGEWCLAVGNPFNLNSTVTAGIVSAKGRNINILKQKYAIESFIQTDAAINPGNSGGALTNASGDLIGINTAIASPTGSYTGYGFAVPANIVSKVIYDLKTYGIVQRGFLGVSIRDLDSKLANEKGYKINQGVYIESVSKNGAADKAGIEAGDVIIEVDGVQVKTTTELQEIIGRRAPGDAIRVHVVRDGHKDLRFDVHLTNKEGKEELTEKASEDICNKLGITIQNTNEKVLKKIGVSNGVEVTSIEEGLVQKHTNMRKGFIITKVDNENIKDIEQFIKIMQNKKGGVMIEGVYPDVAGVFYYAFGM